MLAFLKWWAKDQGLIILGRDKRVIERKGVSDKTTYYILAEI